MALDASELIVAGNGNVYIAPINTPLPDSIADVPGSLDAAFAQFGYTTEDGAKFTDSKDVNKVYPWQSFYPVRTHITQRSAMVEFTLMQWNTDTVDFAFGGGQMVVTDAGNFRYSPPSPETLDERTLVISALDGERAFAIVIPRGFVTSNTESTFAKTGPALLPISFEVLSADEEDPWYLLSDDEAWVPAGS